MMLGYQSFLHGLGSAGGGEGPPPIWPVGLGSPLGGPFYSRG